MIVLETTFYYHKVARKEDTKKNGQLLKCVSLCFIVWFLGR
jgi:hypothetical protein